MATARERLFGFARRHKILTGFIATVGTLWLIGRGLAFARYLEMRPRVLAWREEHAYESLADRLQYEARLRDAAPPVLSTASRESLDADDRQSSAWNPRAESLKLLHSESVARFVARNDEFGFSRMPAIGPSYIELREVERIPLATVSAGPAGESKASTIEPETTAATNAADRFGTPFTNVEGRELHANAKEAFLNPWSFGYVESADRVAGFRSHAFERRPDKYGPNMGSWKTTRLELLSWLKHDTPRVYVSDHLPRLDELDSASTRALNSFESAGLERLKAGEDFESFAEANRIVMLGALRASNNCRRCHDVPHGTLLGAFSYELLRDPPIAAVEQTAVTQ